MFMEKKSYLYLSYQAKQFKALFSRLWKTEGNSRWIWQSTEGQETRHYSVFSHKSLCFLVSVPSFWQFTCRRSTSFGW